MNKYILTISLLLSLLSCSSKSVQPQAPYNLKYEFYSEKNYQRIYRTILNNADFCMKHVGLSKSMAEGQLFSDIKAADISIMQQSFLGKYPHIRVNIEVDKNKTKVIVSNDFESWDELAKAIQGWIINETSFCR